MGCVFLIQDEEDDDDYVEEEQEEEEGEGKYKASTEISYNLGLVPQPPGFCCM